MTALYSTLAWRIARARALKRDGNRCTVARFFGGECSTTLHVHHIIPVEDGGAFLGDDNLATVCSAHHPTWENLRRLLVERTLGAAEAPVRCHHQHRTAEARRLCEARLNRQRVASAA